MTSGRTCLVNPAGAFEVEYRVRGSEVGVQLLWGANPFGQELGGAEADVDKSLRDLKAACDKALADLKKFRQLIAP